jgi:molybdate transport system substrate-binding protein
VTPRGAARRAAALEAWASDVSLVALLPDRFELATVYSAAVTTKAAQPELAARFIQQLAGPASRQLRAAGGFEF